MRSTTHRTTGVSEGCCAAQLIYNGRTYRDIAIRQPDQRPNQEALIPKSHMRLIGSAVVPPCQDTNLEVTETPGLIKVAQIDQYDAGVVVAEMSSLWGHTYVARGAKLPAGLSSEPWLYWFTP
jgi:hypothetical protein